MDLRAENINWDCPAGRQLDKLASLLPKQPQLEITVFGSAPLQLCLDSTFLSQDVDVFSTESAYSYLSDFVTSHDLGQEKAPIYIQVCSAFAFRSALDWPSRAIRVQRHHHVFQRARHDCGPDDSSLRDRLDSLSLPTSRKDTKQK
jgi:hypothetical protein